MESDWWFIIITIGVGAFMLWAFVKWLDADTKSWFDEVENNKKINNKK